jgi:hypothetical protein
MMLLIIEQNKSQGKEDSMPIGDQTINMPDGRKVY